MTSKPQRIVMASGNAGKIAEFNALLAHWDCEVIPQALLNVIPAEETGDSFLDNALLKARAAATQTGLPALADDSGLAVDALDGAPGVYSARFAGPGADDDANNAKLLEALAGVPADARGASYHCVLVYLRHAGDDAPLVCQGSWSGRILTEYRGTGGFGYDPLFYIPELEHTAAELGATEKNRISHRGQAMTSLLEALAREFE